MWEISAVVRLAVSVVLGGLIGFEREAEGKPAGMRTHMLVCLGATLFMLISIESPEFFPGAKTVDPGRIAAVSAARAAPGRAEWRALPAASPEAPRHD